MLKAQLPQNIDLSTGVVNNSTSLASVGSVDDTWSVAVPGGSTFQSAIVSNGIPAGYTSPYPSGSCGRWISPFVVTTSGADFGKMDAPNHAEGTYLYRTTFGWLPCNNTYPVLNVTLAGADNQLVELVINGYSYDLSSYNISFTTLKTFSLPIPAYQLTSGQNVIILAVTNMDSYTGLYLCANLRLSPDITPSITGSPSFCLGSPLTFTGSAASSTVSNHYWEIAESTSSGSIVSGGLNWNSWYSGVPGVFTFPSNLGISCGKYYKIKLATQNACTSWSETSYVIYINCLPTANAGPDITVCQGSCGTIGVAGTLGRGISYQWNGPSGVIGTGLTVNVCPTSTTTYTFTVTNNSTGCSASDYVTVNTAINNSAFNCTTYMTDPSYATISLDPVYTQGYSTPGFYYSFKIEEMNGSIPYYSNTGTDAWWYYPNNKLRGFVSTGTGTYSQSAPGQMPVPPATDLPEGRFLYGHWYKITRTTWNQYCSEESSFITINPVRSMIPADNSIPQLLSSSILVDENISETAASIQDQNIENSIYVYPNPCSGVFNIEMNSIEKVGIDVYDILGKKVKSFEHIGFRSTLDLTSSPKGMYMLRIISGEQVISKKIILE